MPTRNIVLDHQQDSLIEALVQSGRFQDASAVIREGLRLVHGRETAEASKLEALRTAARLGIAALDRGEFKDFPDARALANHLDDVARRPPSGSKAG